MSNLNDYKFLEWENYPEFNDDFAGMIPINGGGGGGVMYIHIDYDESTDAWVCEKTAEEIYSIVESGKYPILVADNGEGEPMYYRLIGMPINGVKHLPMFQLMFVDTFQPCVVENRFTITDTGVEFEQNEYPVGDGGLT